MINHFRKKGSLYIYTLLLSIVLGYAGWILFKTWPIDVYSMEKAGLFGDSFGVITCFFTALGFIGLLINLKEQRNNNYQQAFENNFFQMLNHLNELTKDLSVVVYDNPGIKNIVLGRAGFQAITNSLKNDFNFKRIHVIDGYDTKKLFIERYEEFWDEHGPHLGHYFRWLYHLMSFVDKNKTIDREFYIKLICAQLSTQELVLLYYNASFVRGENFRHLLVKYDIMSNTEPEDLANESHKNLIEGVKFWSRS